MGNLGVLLKTILTDTYNTNKWFGRGSNGTSKVKKILLSLGVILIIGYLVGIVVLYTSMGIDYLSQYNLQYLVISIFLTATVVSTFTMSIFKAKGTLFSKKDTDMLFSMPLKPSTILTAKLANFLIINYVMDILIMIPVLITYAVMVKIPVTYYIYSAISIIVLPIIPTILSSILGYWIAMVSSKSKRKNIVEIIFTFAIVIFIMVISSVAPIIVQKLVTNVDIVNKILTTIGYPIYLIQQAIIESNLLSLIIFVGISLSLFWVFIVLLNKKYIKISMKLQENLATGKYKEKKLVKSSVLSALIKKEFKTYFSIPVYIVNTAFGVILVACMAVASFIYSKEKIMTFLEMGDMSNVSTYMMLMGLFAFIVSMTSTTSSSISLEGKNIDILKSLPVSVKQIFNSKMLINLTILIPVCVISAIILGLNMGITGIQIISLTIVIILMTIVVSEFGIITNLLFPKLNFKSPIQVVKQGMSMFVAMMGMFALDILVGMIYYFIKDKISFDAYVYLVALLLVVLIIIQNIVLTKWGENKFKKLSY